VVAAGNLLLNLGNIGGQTNFKGLTDPIINVANAFASINDKTITNVAGMFNSLDVVNIDSVKGMVSGMNDVGKILPGVANNMTSLNNALTPLVGAVNNVSNAMNSIGGIGKIASDPLSGINSFISGLRL
jgi:hypothetical protein